MSTVASSEPREARDTFGFWRRSYAMLLKEFIQLRRDRVSFAMIVMIPVMQLMLFGYAINTTPRNCRPRCCCRRIPTSGARS